MEDFIGRTIKSITNYHGAPPRAGADGDDELRFTFEDGCARMWHERECCEDVHLTEVVGDFADLVGTPVLSASCETQNDPDADDSRTWTFYKFATARGYVTLRWLGASNGYYSEGVDVAFALAFADG